MGVDDKMKPEYDPNWQEKYSAMISSAKESVRKIKHGQRVFIGTGCGEPVELVQALTDRANELSDIEIVHLLTKGKAPYADKKYEDSFRVNSFFIGQNVRGSIQEGLGDYTPVLMSEIPRLFDSGQMPIDVVLIQVSPPDLRGRVSLGISVDIVKSATENASLVIALVNEKMPYTHGDSLLDIYDLDILVPTNAELLERSSKSIHETTIKIAQYIAALVEDGATLQFGIGRIPGVGRIPPAVMNFLKDKKDLGVHTELITDSILGLIESGAVTGQKKSMDKGKIVASFCMGTRKLYDFIDGNPLFSFRPTDYVNDPYIISRQHKMVSINMAMEIDLTGQVCTDSAGEKFYSGIGGQVDFNRGAARSKDGKAVIVISATDEEARRSRIVTRLSPGSGVVITRGDVHYVVSEHGVAYLHGKNVEERALALISIAHPDFREVLFKEAIATKLIRKEHAEVESGFVLAKTEYKKILLLDDGTEINLRPIRPTDEQGIRHLVYSLSQETLYYRFMSHTKQFGTKQILDFVYVNHRSNVAVVATIPEAHGEDIVGVGRYFLDTRTNRAEVAFVVRDDWHGKGIGKSLFNHLVVIAKKNGIAGFTAEVLRKNRGMQAVINKCGYKVQNTLDEDLYHFQIDF